MKITVKDCYELDNDYQNQFLGREVFPKPSYKKLLLSERSAHGVHYEDVYILEPLHYYYIDFNEDTKDYSLVKIENAFNNNGLIINLNLEECRAYIFNASQNMIYLQKGTKVGEVVNYG